MASTAAATAANASRPSRSTAVLLLHAKALAHEHFDEAAAEVLNHLALSLQCDRVSLGLRVSGKLRVVAQSGAADVSRGASSEMRSIAAAMNESLDQRTPIIFPLPSGASPTVTVAHKALALRRQDARAGVALLSMPVATRHVWFGALLLERHEAFDRATIEAAKDASMFVGPVLAMKHRQSQTLGHRVANALGLSSANTAQPRRRVATLAAGVGATVAALVVLMAVPVKHQVTAQARVEGSVQHVLAAPFEGFIGSVAVRPGATVARGEVLMTLDTRDLALERDQWAAEAAQLDKQYRDALSRDEAAPIVTVRAKLDAVQSRLVHAQAQIERATLRAPMDGVVLSGDFTQAVGAPLKHGQELMTLAANRELRVVAEVDERHIGPVRQGQAAQAVFAGLRGDGVSFQVHRIAPVATPVEGRNVFDVEGQPSVSTLPAHDALRPGMRGVVRIHVGEKPLGQQWWVSLSQAMRAWWWQLGS
jgi:biotin carboxyl carrier protein